MEPQLTYKILGHRGGLFSNIIKVVSWMVDHPEINYFIDWTPPDFSLYGTSVDGNIYDKLFTQTVPEFSYFNKTVTWPHYNYTHRASHNLFKREDWRFEFNSAWERLGLKQDICDKEMQELLEDNNSTAIQIRSPKQSKEHPNKKVPTYQRYLEKIPDNGGLVFLATDTAEVLEYFQKHLGSRLVTRNTKRGSGGEVHLKGDSSLQDAKEVIMDVLCITSCDLFIHSISNIATGALIINPILKSIYLTG